MSFFAQSDAPFFQYDLKQALKWRQCSRLCDPYVFIARQHTYACKARYCFTNSVRMSLRPVLCLRNGHIVTLFDDRVGQHSSYLSPTALQNSKRTPSSGALNVRG